MSFLPGNLFSAFFYVAIGMPPAEIFAVMRGFEKFKLRNLLFIIWLYAAIFFRNARWGWQDHENFREIPSWSKGIVRENRES